MICLVDRISWPGVTAVTPPTAGPDDPQPGRLPGGRGRIVKVTLRVGSSIVVGGAGAVVAAARHESVSSRAAGKQLSAVAALTLMAAIFWQRDGR